MYGCVYYAKNMTSQIEVDFQVGTSGTQCMLQTGNNGSFTANSSGITCYSIGYVENKSYDALDDCAVQESLWTASYSTNTSQFGSTSSYWTFNYAGHEYCEAELRDQVPGTSLCDSEAPCYNTEYNWSHTATPTLYVSWSFTIEMGA